MLYDPIVWKAIEEVAKEEGISADLVAIVYRTPYQFIYNKLKEMPDLFEIDEEDFNKMKSSFNIPVIGKFYINWDKVQRKKWKKQEKSNNEKIKYKED